MNPRPLLNLPSQTPVWRSIQGAFLDALFPPRCAGCSNWCRETFCAACATQLRPIGAPFCQSCGEPFDPLAFAAPICKRCRARNPAFRAARAAFHFDGPLRTSIHRLKYHQKRALAACLAPFLETTLRGDPYFSGFNPDFITPVPLHRARLKKRGFNQSFLLARELSLLIGVPTRQLLRRTRDTPPQVTLRGKERRKNVLGAFVATEANLCQGARILLIDDVLTTGATLDEAAKILRRAGAVEVCALTVAR